MLIAEGSRSNLQGELLQEYKVHNLNDSHHQCGIKFVQENLIARIDARDPHCPVAKSTQQHTNSVRSGSVIGP
jgi:hypothetical protein